MCVVKHTRSPFHIRQSVHACDMLRDDQTIEEQSLPLTTIVLYPDSITSDPCVTEIIDPDEVNKHLLEKSNFRETISMPGISHRSDRRKFLYHRLFVIFFEIDFFCLKRFSFHRIVVPSLILCVFLLFWVLFS